MRKLQFVLALLSVSQIWSRADEDLDEDDEDGSVIALTKDTFDSHISSNKYVLAEFYAPWCGHCKQLAPEYEKAAAQLKKALPSGAKVSLVKIDATEEKELGERFEVRGYPTLIWFAEGKKSEYDGGRTSETILEWVTDATSPAVREVANLSAIPSSKRPVVVLSSPFILSSFEKFADSHRKQGVFYHIPTPAGSTPKVTLQHGSEPVIEAPDVDGLTSWFASHAFPLFGTLDGESYAKYMGRSDHGMVWILLSAGEEGHSAAVEKFSETGRKIGEKLKGKHSVFHIDTVEFKGPIESILGVTEFPAVAVHLKAGDKKKFIYKGEITLEKVTAFVADVEAGKIEAELKSEAIPEKNDGNVRIIVGSTLEKEVFTSDKDVLLEVYAPWCGHCKKLEEHYEKLGKRVKSWGLEDILTIAKMDGTLNDSPVDSITWSGFPTILYIPAGSSTPIPYDGARDAKGMWKWIKAHHSKKEVIANKEGEKKNKKDEL